MLCCFCPSSPLQPHPQPCRKSDPFAILLFFGFHSSENSIMHACMLSRFWLCETLWTLANQAPLSVGFSRQENWSGLPFPTPGIFLTQRLNPCLLSLLHWQADSLPTALPDELLLINQANGWLNPGLQHCRWILYQLSHHGCPRILEWVAYPFSRGSSQPRNQTRASCIAGGFFTSWAIREAQMSSPGKCKWTITIFPYLKTPTTVTRSCLLQGYTGDTRRICN